MGFWLSQLVENGFNSQNPTNNLLTSTNTDGPTVIMMKSVSLLDSSSSSEPVCPLRKMSGVLTGSLAFAGFVLAAETYRNYKEKEEANQEAKVGTCDNYHMLKSQEFSEIQKINVLNSENHQYLCLSGGAENP